MRSLFCVLIFVFAMTCVPAGAEPFTMRGESLLLADTTPGMLCYAKVDPATVQVRSTYDPAVAGSVVYEQGRDYTLDAERGSIARTKDSRIPDFGTNVLYGQKEFDHSKFPGYGNLPFFVYVDYTGEADRLLSRSVPQADQLKKTHAKLTQGGPFKIVTFGDSISAGGEASTEALRFDHRYAQTLRIRFSKAEITVDNGATGGDSTVQGLERLEEKVLTRAPDLVLLGFGMNDHNVGGVPVESFENNLIHMVEQIRAHTGAEVILLSAFAPNPDWMHSSHRMAEYAAATQRAALRTQSAYADVFGVWEAALVRKDLPSLLANNINHPNDFGHWLYSLALEAIEF